MSRRERVFQKVLIANRGEIAVRIIRALREMNIASVAVFSEVDRNALHVQMADEALYIGPAAASDSYLRADKTIDAALRLKADAIHPGYGFLSENAAFAKACEEAGVKFIGPRWQAIEKMGSKTAARRVAMAAGVQIVPGTEQGMADEGEARRAAAEIGYPVLLKAADGGGGKGMRRVDSETDLIAAMRSASSEAQQAFGSAEIYLEKWIDRPRHIEVQVLGDERGHIIHLGERECSIQRRHQKVIEECPSPLMLASPELRAEIGETALRIARAVDYCNAGTLEFLADQSGQFYFLEMNTRLQVEHPVTEWVTGVDLVRWQVRIAAGEALTLQQKDVRWNGSAIECRVYAEDPDKNFFPSPGCITQYVEPSGPGVRVDGGVYAGWDVPLEYDPILAKLSVWAGTREAAIDRMRRAVSEYRVLGITTNLALFGEIMQDSKWRAGELDTGFLDRFMPARVPHVSNEETKLAAILAAATAYADREREQPKQHLAAGVWLAHAREGLLR